MTSRLYPITIQLFQQVFASLRRLGFAMTVVYVCGLLLLDRRQTATRIADWLPGSAHDALNRLLVHPPITTRRLFDHVIQWAKQLGSGYLVVDEVVLEKPNGTNLAWEMLQKVALSGLSIQYVAFDNFYTAGWLTKAISQLGWTWVGMLETKAHVRYHRRLWQAGQLATCVSSITVHCSLPKDCLPFTAAGQFAVHFWINPLRVA